MSSNQYLTEKVNLKLDVELLDALRRRADSEDRTVAAEIRRALRWWCFIHPAEDSGEAPA
jgi:hypothetical protein